MQKKNNTMHAITTIPERVASPDLKICANTPRITHNRALKIQRMIFNLKYDNFFIKINFVLNLFVL